MNDMKKLVYSLLVLCSACLLAWACNSMNESVAVTELEESLDLKSPNGIMLARNAMDLKEFVAKGFNVSGDEFEITDINYHEVTSGYVAIITCLFSDGRIQTALLTDWFINSDGLMTPPANRMKTKSNEIVYGGCIDDDGKMYGCRQASNSSCITCNFSLAEDPTSGELFFICGCHVGSGYCVKVRAA